MSSSDRTRRKAVTLGCALLALALAAGCTVKPLYGTSEGVRLGAADAAPDLAEVRGRVAVSPVADRTSQIVRNALLFRFNGGETPIAPFYQVALTASSYETVVSIQQGTGIPAASLLNMTVSYTVTRTADAKAIAQGRRLASAPFDRNRQLFAASRAYRNAQSEAGREVAEQIHLAISAAIRADLAKNGPPVGTLAKN